MSKENEGMPFVPEEDLNLHENFQPIIAESGLIRPKKEQAAEPDFMADATFTRIDTIQDLIQIRSAEQKAKQASANPMPDSAASSENAPLEEKLPAQEPQKQDSTPAEQPSVASVETVSTEDSFVDLPLLEEVSSAQQEKTAASSVPTVQESALPVVDVPSKPISKPTLKTDLNTDSHTKAMPTTQGKTPPPASGSKAVTPKPKKRRRWVWVLVILCFLFLGTISGVMPVEKIPFLRNLAYAMGFSKNDTARMSFLRALLTWADKTIGLPGQWAEYGGTDSRTALWQRRGQTNSMQEEADLASLQARLARAGGQTNLIDIHALNELQRQKGRQLDEIRGSIMPIPGQETSGDPAEVRDADVAVRTEANQDKGDVFFGSDAFAVNRDFQDGYDSVKMLKKIANPHIADGGPIDWLKNMTLRMMRRNTGLGGINKELHNREVNWATDFTDMGEEKPHRDLYHAWLTSRMSKYTSNLMLKKSLADSSFMGAEIPTTATNVLNVGGVQVDMESLQEDQAAWREYLEWEQKCKKELDEGGGAEVKAAIDSFNEKFYKLKGGYNPDKHYNVSFPQSCSEITGADNKCVVYKQNLSDISAACKKAQDGYRKLEKSCSMVIPQPQPEGPQCSNSTIEILKGYCDTFTDRCNKCAQIQQGEDAANIPSYCTASPQGGYTATTWDDEGHEPNQIEEIVLDQIGGKREYFPQIVKGEKEGTDSQGLLIVKDKSGRVKESIEKGMKKNSALISPF